MASPSPRDPWVRGALGTALSLGAASGLTAIVRTLEPGHQPVLLAVLGLALALLGALPARRRWLGTALTIALGALTATAWRDGQVDWRWGFLLLGACAGVLAAVAAHFGRRAAVAIGLLAILGTGTAIASNPAWLHRFPLHAWNQLHYVLGTKYFEEVGYYDLYPAILMADREGSGDFAFVRSARDMRTYERADLDELLDEAEGAGLRDRFSDSRWAELQADLATLRPELDEGTWRAVFLDLGFNPAPTWLVGHRALTNAVPLDSALAYRRLAMLGACLYLPAFGAAWWAFGARGALWIFLWTGLFFGSRDRLFGGYFSYDWWVLAVVAASLVARGRARLAAPFVAYGGLMRGFGGLVALGPTVQWLSGAARRHREAPWARFLAALAGAMAVVFALSLWAAGGVGAWAQWAHKIALQTRAIQWGGNHVGLGTLFGEDLLPGVQLDRAAREANFAAHEGLLRAVQVAVLLWTAWVARRRQPYDAFALGMIPAFAGMVLSRYYFAAWAVLLVLGTRPERPEGSPWPRIGLFAALAIYDLALAAGWSTEARYQAFNLAVTALFAAILAAYTWRDLRGA